MPYFTAKFFLALLFSFVGIFFFPTHSSAQTIYFQDNFNDGDANGWEVPRNPCWYNGQRATWVVENQKYGIRINQSSCVTETIPSIIYIPQGASYAFDVDMTMAQSVNMDRNFVFKYQDSQNWYGIHTVGNSLYVHKVIGGKEYFLPNWYINYNFQDNQNYHFRVEVATSEIRVYIDGILITTTPDSAPTFPNSKAGLQASAGGISQSEVWFDNVIVSELPSVTPSPTPNPTPSSTPSPSPTPPPLPYLNVVDLKQYDARWKNEIYNDATKWSTTPTIEHWGCALTSVSMILKYWNHNVNPDVLNSWLKSQPDGYLRNGLLNWLAVSRYTKEHSNFLSPVLEYKRLFPNTENLINELVSGRPAVLGNPGHFVVGKGQLPETFAINDPAYPDRPTLNSYGNIFISLGSYKPTHTDLSYIMLVSDGNTTVSVFDSFGNPIFTANSYVQEPLVDNKTGLPANTETLRILLLEKPLLRDYSVLVNGGDGPFQLDAYLYDKGGNLMNNNPSSTTGLSLDGLPSRFDLIYSSDPNTPSLKKLQTTFDSILKDLQILWTIGWINSQDVYYGLRDKLVAANNQTLKGKNKTAKNILNAFLYLLEAQKNKHINQDAYKILKEDVSSLTP